MARGGTRSSSARPERSEFEHDCIERFGPHVRFARKHRLNAIARSVEQEHFERSSVGIDEPEVGDDTFGRVDGTLVATVDGGGARREDLADPIGREAEVRAGVSTSRSIFRLSLRVTATSHQRIDGLRHAHGDHEVHHVTSSLRAPTRKGP